MCVSSNPARTKQNKADTFFIHLLDCFFVSVVLVSHEIHKRSVTVAYVSPFIDVQLYAEAC